MNTRDQIQQRLAALPTVSPLKQAVRDFFVTSAPKFQYGVTLTLKQHTQRSASAHRLNPHSYYMYMQLDALQAARVADDFIARLNREIFRTAAKRHGRSLFYMPVLEGRGAHERLHLHMGCGALPDWLTATAFYRAVGVAAKHTDWVDAQIDVMPADAFLANYLTKTVGRNNTDTVLWQCIPAAGRYAARISAQ